MKQTTKVFGDMKMQHEHNIPNQTNMAKLNAKHYTDPTVFHTEKQHLFRNSWLLAGHHSQLPQDSQMASTIAGIPILLWHRKEGIKAFVNACRHRGAPLVGDGEVKQGNTVRCPYHGWSYNSDGLLSNNTDFGTDCDPLQLFPLHLCIVDQWIFVAFHEPKESPQSLYPTLFHRLIEKRDWTVQATAIHKLHCNWKLYVENYLEGYHIPYIHPTLSKEIKMSSYRIMIRNREIEHCVETKESSTNQGYWAYCWPNLAVNLYANGMSIERILPISPEETLIQYWYLFPKESTASQREEAQHMSATVTQEDIRIVEAIQQTMNSGIINPGPLSPKHEQGVLAFQQWVQESYSVKT